MRSGIFLSLLIIIQFSLFSQGNSDRGYVVKVGDNSPEYVINLTDGSRIKSKHLKGEVVMLQFTASWCGVCKKEMPYIESEIWNEYKDLGLKLYGVDYDEPVEKVIAFAEQTGVTYPMVIDDGGEIFGLFARQKSGVTRNVIIDQNGKIVFLTRLFDKAEFDEMKEVIYSLLTKNQ